MVVGLYVVNLALHALVFSSRNPHIRPRAQNVLLTACRLLFGAPVNVLLGAWLAFWILLWELVRAPLWKPRAVRRVPDDQASVAMCGGGFRTWYHLGVYWGLRDALGAEALQNVKFSGASIGALVAAVAAAEVRPRTSGRTSRPSPRRTAATCSGTSPASASFAGTCCTRRSG